MADSTYNQPHRPTSATHTYEGLERLLAAATVDPQLARRLLTDPHNLVAQDSARFSLSPVEQTLLLALHGSDVYDLAKQLHERIQHELWSGQDAPELETGEA